MGRHYQIDEFAFDELSPNSSYWVGFLMADASVQICSRRLFKRLGSFGVVPRKSGVAVAPNHLLRNVHFWRGMVDGNGWVSVQRKGKLAVLGLCGGPTICEQFKAFVQSIAPTKANLITNHSIFSFRVFARKAQAVLSVMYPDGYVALDRKFEASRRCLAI